MIKHCSWLLVNAFLSCLFVIQGENIVKISLGPNKNRKNWKTGKRYTARNYTKWNVTKLTVLANFDNWEKLSKPRNLAYSSGKVYVTDRGLHKVASTCFWWFPDSSFEGSHRWSCVRVTVCCGLSGLRGFSNYMLIEKCRFVDKSVNIGNPSGQWPVLRFVEFDCPTAMSIVQTGKWRKPTGVLVDQVGHLLVVDQVKHVINSLELLTRHAGQR